MEAHKFSFKIIFLTLMLVQSIGLQSYVQPSHISHEVWKKVSPYLLPEDHPAKAALDQIFSSSRAILNLKSMKKAGFIDPFPREWTHVIVCTHPNLEGYIIKTYLDAQRNFHCLTDYEHWLRRISGANLINQEIRKNNWGHLFKSPKKWIYMLPDEPSPPEHFIRKDFILVEEDMNLLDNESNLAMWKSELVTEELLAALYHLLQELGLNDCAKPDNAPFSSDGKIAFIDTETHHHWPVNYSKLTSHLSLEMKSYWRQLHSKKQDK